MSRNNSEKESVKAMLEAECDEILNTIQNSLVTKAMEEGRIPIGYTCSHVPDVLLSADRLFPLRLRTPAIAGNFLDDAYLPSTVCSYCRNVVGFGMDGGYEFLGGWVFNSSCQHMNRCSDVVKHAMKPPFVHVLDALHTCTESTLLWMVEELKILADRLSSHFDVEINEDSLAGPIAQYNEFMFLMKEIDDSRKFDSPLITGAQFQKLMISSLAAPKDLLLTRVQQFREVAETHDRVESYRARLMIMGGVIDNPGYIEIIEGVGCLVVGDHFCTGLVRGLSGIPEGPGDAFERIARYTMAKPCPRMLDSIDTRLTAVLDTVKERRVDGVIIEQLKFCDPMNYYGLVMAEYLREAGIPVLRLDREYGISGEGQLRTRVQAFVESLGK